MLIFNLSIDGLEIGQEVYFIQDNKVKHGKVKSWGFSVLNGSVKVYIDIEHLTGFKEFTYNLPEENSSKLDEEAKLQSNEYYIEGKLQDFDLYLTKDDLIESLWDESN